MKKHRYISLLFVLIAMFLSKYVWAQPCLPSGIAFTSQQGIDNFKTNFPNCTEIQGSLAILPNPNTWTNDIVNLYGLDGIVSVGGLLSIGANPFLTTLTGLDNLREVKGDLFIQNNNSLQTLTGLDGLKVTKGLIRIIDNPALLELNALEGILEAEDITIQNCVLLQNLHGLRNMYNVIENDFGGGGNFNLKDLPAIQDLSGLINLTYVEKSFSLSGLHGLTDLTGLASLKEVGSLFIDHNENLVSLKGIDSLQNLYIEENGTSGLTKGNLSIRNNSKLKDITSLARLKSIAGITSISFNKSLKDLKGLDSVRFVGANFDIIGNDSLTYLTGLGSLNKVGFFDEYNNWLRIAENPLLISLEGISTLDSINGGMLVSDNPKISDLKGLENLKYIGDDFALVSMSSLKDLSGLNETKLEIRRELSFSNNESLISLKGIEALKSLGGGLRINDNPQLLNLIGLNSLESIGDNLSIHRNRSLNSMGALMSLKSLNGANIAISDNDMLPSLSGLDNVVPESITQIIISRNPMLSICAVPGICEFLKLPRFAQFSNNAQGCNSRPQVNEICNKVCSMEVSIQSEKDTLCLNEELSLTIEITEGIGPFTYLWSTGESSSSIIIEGSESRMYSITVTDSEDCSATADITIVVIPVPNIEFTISNTTCGDDNGSAELIHEMDLYEYLWHNGSMEQLLLNLPAGPINVTISDQYGCKYELGAEIEDSETLSVEILGDLSICEGETGHLYLDNIFESYLWNDGNIESTLEYVDSGIYSVTVTEGPCKAESMVMVSVNKNPIIDFIIDNINITIEITMGLHPYRINWSTGENTLSIEPNESGVYSVTVTDANDCSVVAETNFIYTNVKETELDFILVYPNPIRNFLHVDMKQNLQSVSMQIYDAVGKLVFERNLIDTSAKISVQHLSAGGYFLKITTDSASRVWKVVKE